jgi:hypothetical protein
MSIGRRDLLIAAQHDKWLPTTTSVIGLLDDGNLWPDPGRRNRVV